jgi:hypothetical protein
MDGYVEDIIQVWKISRPPKKQRFSAIAYSKLTGKPKIAIPIMNVIFSLCDFD